MYLLDKKGIVFIVRVFILAILCFISIGVFQIYEDDEEIVNNTLIVATSTLSKKETAVIALVGDTMLDRGVKNKVNKLGGGDYDFVFEKIKDDLGNYDLIFGNLEGPVSDKGTDVGGIYSFRMDPLVLPSLKKVGFRVLSVANNHINNWGGIAIADTMNRLESAGIVYSGGGFNEEEAYSGKIILVGDTKISFLSFSQFGTLEYEAVGDTLGVAVISEEKVRSGVAKANESADVVIVTFHFGDEYQKIQNAYQEKYAKMAIDTGADLVVGHHPHVVQPLEMYKGKYIAYSLGNFVFDQYFSEETMRGALLEVYIEEGKIERVNMRDISIDKDFRPSFD